MVRKIPSHIQPVQNNSTNQPQTMADEKDKRIRDLERKLDDAIALNHAFVETSKRQKTGLLDKETRNLIKSLVRKRIFKTFKFTTSEEQNMYYVNAVVSALNIEEHKGNDAANIKKRAEFVVKYAKYIKRCLNDARNYVQSEMKKSCFAYLEKDPNNTIPDFRKLLLCLQRKLEINDENKPVILFYMDLMMPKMTGNGDDYNEKIRYYETISDAKSDPDQAEMDVTCETEAFGLLVIENNYTKWPTLHPLEKTKEPNKKLTIIETKKEDHTNKNEEKYHYFYVDDHPNLRTKWTDPTSGKVVDGGWTREGIERFAKFRKHCRYNRLTEEGKEWEKKQWKCCEKNTVLLSQTLLCSRKNPVSVHQKEVETTMKHEKLKIFLQNMMTVKSLAS